MSLGKDDPRVNDPRRKPVSLDELQAEHRVWVEHNFPGQTPAQMVMGLAEEVGELAHAQLKSEQGIRGDWLEHERAGMDAVGDLVIYLSSYCTCKGWSLATCVQTAWDEVKDRDWVKFPDTGRPPTVDEYAAQRHAEMLADIDAADEDD